MDNSYVSNVRPDDDKPPTRSVGEMLQRLGATEPFQVWVLRSASPAGNATLEVHPETEARLLWKPVFRAVSNDTSLTFVISSEEAEALMGAGAPALR